MDIFLILGSKEPNLTPLHYSIESAWDNEVLAELAMKELEKKYPNITYWIITRELNSEKKR